MTRSIPIIKVENLSKFYRVWNRKPGLLGAAKHLFSRKYQIIKAVDGIDFEIREGEAVGYIGRNGAGKSTTIKMLTGILVPSDGIVTVDGIIPYRKRSENGKKIGVVFGQRTHLRWDIPVQESFRLLKEIYEIPKPIFEKNLKLFDKVLELGGLITKPVRKLSLGQRMKCGLAAAFLHDPKIVYLDEPTIGLDIIIKENLRQFIKLLNKEMGTTVILTTHDLRDIEDICHRSIIIEKGRVVFDGELSDIREKYAGHKTLIFDVKKNIGHEDAQRLRAIPGAEAVDIEDRVAKLHVDHEISPSSEVMKRVMEILDVADMSTEEPSIESVVKAIYQEHR